MRSLKNIPEEANESNLWHRFRQGEELALEQLMIQNFQVLYRYGTKFSRDDAFIKDCIQDLFLDLWDRREFLGETITVKAYLMASLRRRLHRGGLSKRWVFDDSLDSEHLPFTAEFSVEDSFIREETTQAIAYEIKAHLDQLPKRQKEVVYLKFFEELDREEIAGIMGINHQSVSNLLQAAFKHLKAAWKAEFFIFILLTIVAFLQGYYS
jgi:RNA polymerase sigma factor (sigma-70 family)